MPLTVLITTSGTGSRIGRMTKYTNKALVPVGDKYAIARIIELYPNDTEFIITVGYLSNLVREFISLAYPKHNIVFIDVDLYEGPGSSQVYSMLKAEPYLRKPFIFHCCDTITTAKPSHSVSANIIYVNNEKTDTNTYASITISGELCSKVQLKGAVKCDYIYIGIVEIFDHQIFWSSLQHIYLATPDNSSMSDVLGIIGIMVADKPLKYRVCDFWDTGNETSYQHLCEWFPCTYSIIARPTESLCFLPDYKCVIKFISNKDACRNFVLRGEYLSPNSVKIIESTDNFVKMEYLNGHTLAVSVYPNTIAKLLEWARINLWINPISSNEFARSLHNYYLRKTEERLEILDLSNERNIVNGIQTGPVRSLIYKIPDLFLGTNTKYNFHGDFTIDNIMIVDSKYKLLDWRPEFDGDTEYGDIYYDLAKLQHSIFLNHAALMSYMLKITEDEVFTDIKTSFTLAKQVEAIDIFANNNNLNIKKIRIITALLWIHMAPLYEGELRDFLFYFGKLNLALLLVDN